jgi:hypothetical protein
MPSIGDTVIQYLSYTNVSWMSPGGNGQGQTWNFSGLSVDNTDTIIFLNPFALSGSFMFPSANLASYNPANPSGVDFYRNDFTGFYILGSYVSMLPQNYWSAYMPPMKYASFPFGYGSAYNDTCRSSNAAMAYSPPLDSQKVRSTIYTQAQGTAEGTLMLDDGVFPTLRSSVNQTIIDSVFYYKSASGWDSVNVNQVSQTSYIWWTYDSISSFFKCAMYVNNVSGSTVAFARSPSVQHIVSVPQSKTEFDFSVFPNPAQELLQINVYADGKMTYKIYDMRGREVLSGLHLVENNFAIDISSLSSGMYRLELTPGVDGLKCQKSFVKE